jgi:hypothetical protein
MPAYDQLHLNGYCEGLGMSGSLIDQIKRHVSEYRIATGAAPEFLFVENPVSPLGSVEFSNLILLTGKTYAEFSLNQPSRTITFVDIANNINRIVMPVIQQATFGEITERSRLTVQICNDLQVIGFFMASGANCDDLLEVVKRYFIPAVTK